MLGSSPVDAYDRVASRAYDLREAFRAGSVPLNDDVRREPHVVPSSDPLSVVPPPNAWLVIRDRAGGRAYERDGSLTLADGVLRARDGAEVLGYPRGEARGAVPVPLRIEPGEHALGRGADARIESDGTVAYTRAAIDPRNGARSFERIVLGRVALARFPAGTQPVRLGGARVGAPPGVVPHLGLPADGGFPPLAPSSRDAGSIDIAAGVARLDEAYRAFEALGAAVKSRSRTDKTAVDLVK